MTLKIGVIGLGNIAQKAYLPILGTKSAEFHLCTRNTETLKRIGQEYRFTNLHDNIASLLATGITGAFVHTSTEAHASIIEQLLNQGIHVCVDKPIAYDYSTSERLVNLAKEKRLLLNVAFNRRFAPAYQRLAELKTPNMVVMQKNRESLPGSIRSFVFDDFIHVIDTLLYLFPYPLDELIVQGKKKDGLLHHVVIQLVAAQEHGAMAIGIMNRDSGNTEEILEVFSSAEKRKVVDLNDEFVHQGKKIIRTTAPDWQSTLYKRGFVQLIDLFLEAMASPAPHLYQTEVLQTHLLCEQVVEKLM